MSRFKRIKRLPALVAAFSLVALVSATLAIATDIITGDANSITSNIDPSVEKAPGTSGSGLFALVVQNNTLDGDPNGCNAGVGGSKPPVVLAISTNQSWLTVTQSTVSLTDCDDSDPGLQDAATVNFQVSSSAPADATAVVTATYQSGGVSGGKYQTGSFQVKTPAAPADTTAPTSSASAKNTDDTPYAFDTWTNQDVTVTLSGEDESGGSGLKEIRYTTNGTDPTASSGTIYTAPFTISTQGTTTVKWRAIDNLGNLEAVHSETVKIDKVAPTITDLGPTAGPTGDNGWYTTNVTNQFQAVDTLSGLSAACDAAFDQTGDVKNVTISDEGAAVKGASGSCADNAGNTAASKDSAAFMIDKTAPVVSVTGVSNGASYTVGSVPAAGCSTSDALSGVQTQASLTETGGPVGSVTATCSGAEDNAGNAAPPVGATYSILFAFNGFYQPIDNNGVFNKAKAGSAIPVKFSLDGPPQPGSNTPGLGGATSAFALGTATNPNPVAVLVACPTITALFDQVEELAADSNSGLKYDATADQWVYVWKTTTAAANSCRQLKVTLADGTTKTANFQFTK
jgi:hypothetical protein